MSFLTNDTLRTEDVAKELLGCLLVKVIDKEITTGWIVETEAYVGIEDEASHSYNGKDTPRMRAMFEEAGTFYVYQMHSHHLLNVVTKEKGNPQAVLVRAIEPCQGIELLEKRRNKTGVEATNGPGKLAKAMGITMADNFSSVHEPSLFIDAKQKLKPKMIEQSKRIGIPNKGAWTDALLRYTVKGNPYVSRKKGKTASDYGWQALMT